MTAFILVDTKENKYKIKIFLKCILNKYINFKMISVTFKNKLKN